MRHVRWFGFWVLIALAAGCTGPNGERREGWPRLFGPGPADYQRQRAQRFDPYADPNMSNDNNMQDARPRDYQLPPAEPTRDRWQPGRWVFPPRYGTS
ncbi:MAG TPA: hypothetical protein VND64_30665 [Pirellulales bacterium]|nr:hypothetical protein [Pirellulales bacterium]